MEKPFVQIVLYEYCISYVALELVRDNVYELLEGPEIWMSLRISSPIANYSTSEHHNWGNVAIHQTKLLYGELAECKTESLSGLRSYLNQ